MGNSAPSSRGRTGADQLELPISLAMEIGPEVSQSPRWANWSKSWSFAGTIGGKKPLFLGFFFLAGFTSLVLLSFTVAIWYLRVKVIQSKAEIRDGERFLMALFHHLNPVLLEIRCVPGVLYMHKFFSSRVSCISVTWNGNSPNSVAQLINSAKWLNSVIKCIYGSTCCETRCILT